MSADEADKTLKQDLEDTREDLKRTADEIRVKLHLAGMDAKDAHASKTSNAVSTRRPEKSARSSRRWAATSSSACSTSRRSSSSSSLLTNDKHTARCVAHRCLGDAA